MLILTRKKDESIIVNGNIEVKILAIEDGKVSIGIEAPKDIDIFRKELYDSIEEENIKASNIELNLQQMNQLIEKNRGTK